MTPKSNVHTHTIFSDGRNDAEAMVQAALALGFHTLGVSDHGYSVYDDGCMSPEGETAYRAECARLKEKYSGRIHLLCGYEHDWLSPPVDDPYDYQIESVHFVREAGEVFPVDYSRPKLEDALRRLFGGDPYALCRAYFRTVCESCASHAEILGHIDLVTKFNEQGDLFDPEDPRYLSAALETADCAAERGGLVEINSGAIARGYRTAPYPGQVMLRRLAEKKARVILSSDCHDARFLDCAFEDSAALARACGFKTAWMYRGAALEEYPL